MNSLPRWDDPTRKRERDEAVIGLVREKHSAQTIAAMFPDRPTRNAVAGLVMRLKKHHPDLDLTPHVRQAPPRARRVQPDPAPSEAMPPEERFSLARFDSAFRPLPGREPVALLDHRAGECRWPVGGALANGPFCGVPTGDPARSYCAAHRRLSVPQGVAK